MECGAGTINWSKNSLGLFDNFSQLEKDTSELIDNGGVYFVPCMSGLYSPYWNNSAKSLLLGLSLNSSKSHIMRALLEGLAYRVKDCFLEMAKHNMSSETLITDGGVTQNKFFLKLQQSILGNSTLLSKPVKKF